MTDAALLEQFFAGTYPRDQWNHRAHLKVAYLLLRRFPFPAALDQMRVGIRAYNAAQGIVDSPTGGYHETMTVAWMRIMFAMLCEYGPAETADAFLDSQPQLGEKKLLRLFYSAERLMSPEAKQRYVEPDLAALPVSEKVSGLTSRGAR